MPKSKRDAEIEATEIVNNSVISQKYQEDTKKFLTKMISHPAYDNKNYKWSLNDFELGNRLGQGRFGRVYLAQEKLTGYLVAMKTLEKHEIIKDGVEKQVLREIEIQSHLKHPNVLELMTWFHDDLRIYLVLEFAAKGELYKHLKKSLDGHFDEHLSAKYIYQVADAVNYCHNMKVIHRDIKPKNLLLSVSGDIKLADFGCSVHAPSLRRQTRCGTRYYLPPEMVEKERNPYSQYVDNWCLGILCFEFLVGYPPFKSKSKEETYTKICKIDIKYPSSIPSGAIDLISKLLKRSSTERITLDDVLHHTWIISNK